MSVIKSAQWLRFTLGRTNILIKNTEVLFISPLSDVVIQADQHALLPYADKEFVTYALNEYLEQIQVQHEQGRFCLCLLIPELKISFALVIDSLEQVRLTQEHLFIDVPQYMQQMPSPVEKIMYYKDTMIVMSSAAALYHHLSVQEDK